MTVNKPMDARTVAYLKRQQQLTLNSKCIEKPFATSNSVINKISEVLSDIENMVFPNNELTKCRTSKY